MAEPYRKTIVCLANSRKPPAGQCVAGLEVLSPGLGGWIRPVSARPTEELMEAERCYNDHREPRPLDIIAITFKAPRPRHHQQENHLIDAGQAWIRMGRMPFDMLRKGIEDPGGSLWLNGHSSRHGLNDRVPESAARTMSRSLYLIQPNGTRSRGLRRADAQKLSVFGTRHYS